MEVKRILFRKELKLVTLLLTSMLIASASAAVYYSMVMQPDVTVSTPTIKFVQGDDWPGGSLPSDGTWVRMTLKAYPNATLTYDEPLNISNTDLSNAHTFRLRHLSISPASGSQSVSNFTFINFVIKDNTGATRALFYYNTTTDDWNLPGTTPYLSVNANTAWTLYVQTKAAAGATTSIEANIQIAVDVEE